MGYSNWLYREVPRRHLAWSHRAAAITAELAHWRPDVVACQEVDHYHDLASRLAPLG
jgi:mRNA deadenylase 3'-5' endonuclease subunit Ccr4